MRPIHTVLALVVLAVASASRAETGQAPAGAPPTGPPAAPPAAAAPATYPIPTLSISTILVPGASVIQGQVTSTNPKMTALPVSVCISDPVSPAGMFNDAVPALCDATLGKGTRFASIQGAVNSPPSVLTTLPAGGFTIQLAIPLAPGQTVEVVVPLESLTASQYIGTLPPKLSKPATVPTTIPTPTVTFSTPLTTANKTITGTLSPMPYPLVPAAGAAATATPSPSNYPQIAVCVADLNDVGAHSYDPRCPMHKGHLADLVSAANATASFVPVQSTGAFAVTLNAALTPGQTAAVLALPPAGYLFADNAGTENAVVATPKIVQVLTALAVSQPIIISGLAEGSTSLTGIATVPASGSTINVGLIVTPASDQKFIQEKWIDRPANGPCVNMDKLSLLDDFSLGYTGLDVLATVANSSATFIPVGSNGTFSVTLSTPLTAGEQVRVVQLFPAGTVLPDQQKPNCNSGAISVPNSLDWGLVRAYFTAGVVLDNDSSGFSQANQFYALNLDKTWALPGCTLRLNPDAARRHRAADAAPTTATLQQLKDKRKQAKTAASAAKTYAAKQHAAADAAPADSKADAAKASAAADAEATALATTLAAIDQSIQDKKARKLAANQSQAASTDTGPLPEYSCLSNHKDANGVPIPIAKPNFWQRHAPGFSSYFEARFTAIPVGTVNGAGANAPAPATPPATGTAAPVTSTNLLSSDKTILVGGGAYIPILFTRWQWQHQPNALFIAPLAKIGFDSLAQPTTQTVVEPGGASATAQYEQIYNYHSYGARIGHMQLSTSRNRAPETLSYLDVVFGPYSNLESLICHQTINATQYYAPGGSACAVENPTFYGSVGTPTQTVNGVTTTQPGPYIIESRKRLYRLDLEGLLKIPATPFYIGFNANIGQHEIGAAAIDPAFSAPDDIRFFFGAKFDIASLLQKLNLGPH